MFPSFVVSLSLCLGLALVWSPASSMASTFQPQQSYVRPVSNPSSSSFGGTQASYVQEQISSAPVEQPGAVVNIVPGAGQVHGKLFLYERGPGVYVTGYIRGLTPGLHGFHVHEVAALGNQCKDAGPHFNPFMRTHGSPQSAERHVGDLGNIQASQYGDAHINFYDGLISLNPASPSYIGDRSFVVHEKEDDLGLGGDQSSLATGNAGGRLGCGLVIVRAVPATILPAYLTQSRVVYG
ncbi:superoxide dismutase [Cu-Zn]-like [Oratosquilla oratoria]|uniref:superoxide dismutase [Cu-Zn]-like n=1 Tax=Oratosquilla oratoria TaxID=337810 RepID=UPI003F75C277